MPYTKNYNGLLIILVLVMILMAFINVSLGSVQIPLKDILSILIQQDVSDSSWSYIILEYRLPKVFTAILTGSGLAVSGLLMQTLFRNPLAGPYVLGLSSGASLGIALVIMGSSLFGGITATLLLSKWSLVLASSIGSLVVLLAVLLASARLRDTMAILIIGLMFASLTAAIVSVLAFFSTAAQLQQYIFWSFGSLGNLAWEEVLILTIFWFIGILLSITCIKNLNTLLLGEQYAKSLGVSIRKNRIVIIIATSLLAGSITAFAGPIAFIGCLLYTSDAADDLLCVDL